MQLFKIPEPNTVWLDQPCQSRHLACLKAVGMLKSGQFYFNGFPVSRYTLTYLMLISAAACHFVIIS